MFFNIGFLMFVFRYYTTAKSVDRILKGTAKRDQDYTDRLTRIGGYTLLFLNIVAASMLTIASYF